MCTAQLKYVIGFSIDYMYGALSYNYDLKFTNSETISETWTYHWISLSTEWCHKIVNMMKAKNRNVGRFFLEESNERGCTENDKNI